MSTFWVIERSDIPWDARPAGVVIYFSLRPGVSWDVRIEQALQFTRKADAWAYFCKHMAGEARNTETPIRIAEHGMIASPSPSTATSEGGDPVDLDALEFEARAAILDREDDIARMDPDADERIDLWDAPEVAIRAPTVLKLIAQARAPSPPFPEGQEDGWRGIESAPKDRFVLLYTPADEEMNGFVAMAKWQGGSWFGIDDEGLTFNPLRAWDRVTHWMPLPPAPLPGGGA